MQTMTRQAQYVELNVPGEYWDSQIYAGELTLFRADGALTTIRWDEIIEAIKVSEDLKLPLNIALNGNSWLYQEGAQRLMTDPELRALLYQRFERLALLPGPFHVDNPSSSTRTNPLPFPHSDSEIFKGRLYVGNKNGVFTAQDRGADKSLGRMSKLTDSPALALAAKFGGVAHAGGSEGLFETPLPDRYSKSRAATAHLSSHSCNSCEWASLDVVAANSSGDLFVAAFQRDLESIRSGKVRRMFTRIREAEELFVASSSSNPPRLSWGSHDKVFQAKRR